MDELTPEEVTSIVKRAAEIDGVDAVPHDGGMAAALVEASAVEAGISLEAVQQAMREHRLLRADGQARRGSLRVDVSRPSEHVSAAVDSFLRDAGFAPVERDVDISIWESDPSTGRQSPTLAGVSRVTVSIVGGGGTSTVAIRLDTWPRRLLHVGGASAGAAVVGVGGWAAAGGAWPMTVFVGGAGLALAVSQIREATTGQRRRMRQAVVALECYLTSL